MGFSSLGQLLTQLLVTWSKAQLSAQAESISAQAFGVWAPILQRFAHRLKPKWPRRRRYKQLRSSNSSRRTLEESVVWLFLGGHLKWI